MSRRNVTYDYQSSWAKYAFEEEENRFLSADEDDLMKICDCIDLKKKKFKKTSGGIPVHYENDKLYVLKNGPHSRVEGESGSKKSRTIARGAVVTAVLNKDSILVTDPKGEISSDRKIQGLLKSAGVDVHVLDFRNFDKDGVNPLLPSFELLEQGKVKEAMSAIDKFVEMLKEGHQGSDDPYWNGQAGDLIRFACQMACKALVQLEGGKDAYNLSTIKSFIVQEKRKIKYVAEALAKEEPMNAACKGYNDILQLPDRTYSCVISSANALLSEFASSEALTKMMSIATFDIRKFYSRPSALFLVIPDEHNTYDMLAGYLIDQFYQILVEEYSQKYQGVKQPACGIKFICDEAANLKINGLAAKVSASRSREIDWTIIFQSERQMQEAYKKDWPTICGNCKNRVYLGSSDYDILKNISEQVGVTYITMDGRPRPLVSVDDLRKMRKENDFKDALILTGNHIFCAQLPDYDVYPFLKKGDVDFQKRIELAEVKVYTPSDLYTDHYNKRISFKDEVGIKKFVDVSEDEDKLDLANGDFDWLWED